MTLLELELSYFDVKIQKISHYITHIPYLLYIYPSAQLIYKHIDFSVWVKSSVLWSPHQSS